MARCPQTNQRNILLKRKKAGKSPALRGRDMFKAELDGKEIEVMQLEDWKTSIENDFKPGDYFDEGISWD